MPDTHTKVAATPEQAQRLRREAEVLAVARHPGVVELLGDRAADPDVPALITAWAGECTLARAGRLTIEESAGVIAALADTVADLHRMAIVHGRIDASHVVLSPTGMPVLCGFGDSGPAATINDRGVLLEESTDVHDLGALLRDLVIDEGGVEPIPEQPWWRGGLRPWTGYGQRSLLTLADQATDDDPGRRPTAARFADMIRDAVPDACLWRASDRNRDHDVDDVTRRARPTTLALGLVGVMLIVLGLAAMRGSSGAAPPLAVAEPTIVSPAPLLTPTTTGGTIVVGEHHYAIGEPDDVVVVGDWDCDGRATAAVLRPSTGNVFRFDGWATTNVDISVTPSATVPGAVGLHAVRGADGCDRLVARLADGTEKAVTT